MHRSVVSTIVFLVLVIVVLSGLPWPVTVPAQYWIDQSLPANWTATVEKARWTPRQALVLSDLRVKIPTGGKLHFERVEVLPTWKQWMMGRYLTHWTVEGIRVDPGSFKIKKEAAQAVISSGPVIDSGHWTLSRQQGVWRVPDGEFSGRLLEGQWMFRQLLPDQIELDLKGRAAHRLLAGLGLMSVPQAEPEVFLDGWESLRLKLVGPMDGMYG